MFSRSMPHNQCCPWTPSHDDLPSVCRAFNDEALPSYPPSRFGHRLLGQFSPFLVVAMLVWFIAVYTSTSLQVRTHAIPHRSAQIRIFGCR